jgi:hypothetical protein
MVTVNKRQDNKLENCCIWFVIYLNWLIKNLKLTVLQNAKPTFAQISEVVMSVASLDGHQFCLVTD